MAEMHPLKTYREKHEPRLSQEALARKLGVARLTIVRWEKGERKIGDTRLVRISEKTGIPAKELRPDLVGRLEELEKLVGSAQ